MAQKPIVHHRDHEYFGADPVRTSWEFGGEGDAIVKGRYEIKLFPDPEFASIAGIDLTVQAGDSLFIFMAPWDLDENHIIRAAGYVSYPATGDIVIQVRDTTTAEDLLSVPITIPGGGLSSLTGAVAQPEGTGSVNVGDLISIDVDSAGSEGMGLGVIVEFGVG